MAEEQAAPEKQFSIQKIISAISNHPHMVWGTAGFDTALMLHYKGKVIGKRGAAGVYVSGIEARTSTLCVEFS